MSNFTEANTIRDMLFDAAGFNGWMLMDGGLVPREGNIGLPFVPS